MFAAMSWGCPVLVSSVVGRTCKGYAANINIASLMIQEQHCMTGLVDFLAERNMDHWSRCSNAHSFQPVSDLRTTSGKFQVDVPEDFDKNV